MPGRWCCAWWTARCWSRPRAGPDGRYRYAMLETLRAYGARLLDEAGEADPAAAALAGYALGVAERAAAGLQTSTGEGAAARWLDAEDAAIRQVLGWAGDHDAAMALRLAAALAPWWHLRGRLPSQYPLLREAGGRAEPGGEAWCTVQVWLGLTAVWSADPVAALGHFTAVRDAIADRGPSRALADGLGGRSLALAALGRTGEAADDSRRALALAREAGDPAGEALVLMLSAIVVLEAGDVDGGVRLARQSRQVTADIPGWIARASGSILTEALIAAGDLTAAERSCSATLASARDAGDLGVLPRARPDARGRGARRGDEPGHRDRVRPHAHRPQPAIGGAVRRGQAQRPERELVTLVAQGRTNGQIAAELYITVRTVSSHLDRIRDKTGCRRRADLTRLALSAGLV